MRAGGDLCAFLRGEAEVFVVASVRPALTEAVLELPPVAAGRWSELLADHETELGGAATTNSLGPGYRGLWLLERR